jgi:hypothetical protein
MHFPSCRSAWPSIHAPIASRSWLAVSFIAIRMSACESTSLCTTAGRCVITHGMKPRTRPRRTISLDMAEETLPAFDRPLRRPQIGLVENEVQRLFIRLVQRFGKCRHETPARGITAELGEIDDANERFSGNQPAEGRPHFGGDRHVGVATAKHHDRIAGGAAVGAGAQAPPHTERIHNCDTRAHLEQPFDKALGRIGLARAGSADDRDTVIKSVGGKSGRQIVIASGGTDCAGMFGLSLAARAAAWAALERIVAFVAAPHGR